MEPFWDSCLVYAWVMLVFSSINLNSINDFQNLKLAAVDPDAYEALGKEHTSKDTPISRQEVEEIQKTLNGHVSSMVKIFNMGDNWGHTRQAQEDMHK